MTRLLRANRHPNYPEEILRIQREGPAGRWHARDAAERLVACDQYRNDLIPMLEADGFAPVFQERSSS